jgi:hypothetical protein
MNLIKDQNEFEKFLNILPELEKDEVYFISLSARNKYLSKEERLEYSLGQTEMFGREIAQSKEKLKDYIIRKLEATLSYKTTRNHLPIPEKSLVCYMNVNPSSMVKAYMQFQNEMNRQVSEIVMSLQKQKLPNYSFINLQTKELLNCIQKSGSRKYFIDIDCDTKNEEVYQYLFDSFIMHNIEFHTIETKGGYHFLLQKKSFPEKFDLNLIIKTSSIIAQEREVTKIEIMINSNAMVPVPGTMQSDHLVKFRF